VALATTNWHLNKRQVQQDKVEKEKEKKENESPFGQKVSGID
jgi:hypothetical protein